MASIEKRVTERVTEDGKTKKITSYRVKIRMKGFALESATFDRKTDAKNWADKIEAEIKAGRHFGVSKRHLLSELLDRYSEKALPKLKSAATVKAKLDFWRKLYGNKRLSEITPDVITKACDKLASTPKQRGGGIRSAADVNRTLAALSSALSYAVKPLEWLDRNPVPRVVKASESRGRVRFLSDEEMPRLLEACRTSGNRYLYLAVVLALTTGGRKSEIMSLRWRQIDLKNRTAMLGDTKNGDARALPLSGEALTLLQAAATVRVLDDDRLFPPRPKSKLAQAKQETAQAKRESKSEFIDLRAPFDSALKAAGITDFHWHDLRHTAASYLAMAGTTPLEISKVLGHKTMAMVSRYSHLSSDRVVELGDLLAARMGINAA